MTGDNFSYNCIPLSIGNTDFQIIFSKEDWFQQNMWNADMHFHLLCECHFLKNGTVLLKMPEQTLTLPENALFVLPSNIQHAFETLTDSSERISFHVEIAKNKTTEHDTFSIYNGIFSSDTFTIYDKLGSHFDLILQLIREKSSSDFLFELKLKHLFSLVLIEVLEHSGTAPAIAPRPTTVGYEEELKLRIESFIVNNFSLDAHLDDLARYLRISPRQTERTLQRIFGKSFQEIKTEKRIEAAKHLMATSMHSLKTIAEMVGYSSYPGFYKTFQLYTGLSPDEYRKNCVTKDLPL